MPIESRKSKVSLVTFLVLLFVLLVANFVMVAPYLLAVLMGGILASITRPIFLWLCSRKWRPYLAAAVLTLAVLVLVIGPLIGFLIAAVDQALDLGKKLNELKGLNVESLANSVTHWKPLRTIIGDPTAVEQQLREAMQKGATYISGTLLGIFSSLPNLGLQLVLSVLSYFFFLVDGSKFYQWMWRRIPLDVDVRASVYESFHETAFSSLAATIAAALVQAAVMLVAFIVIGVPGAFFAAGATFIFAWIPILGSAPVWLGGAIYLIVNGETGGMIAMLAFGTVASISDNVVRPYVLGGKDEMHPLVSLVSIFGGIVMFGLFGVFIGPILTALLLSLLQMWPWVGARFQLIDAPISFSSAPQKESTTFQVMTAPHNLEPSK